MDVKRRFGQKKDVFWEAGMGRGTKERSEGQPLWVQVDNRHQTLPRVKVRDVGEV